MLSVSSTIQNYEVHWPGQIELDKGNWPYKWWNLFLHGESKTGHWFDHKYINAVLMSLYGFIWIRFSSSDQP